MFKKNPTRPPIIIQLRKSNNGYRVISNETHNLFSIRKINRSVYRPDLMQPNFHHEGGNTTVGGSVATSPNHVTIPAFADWFDLNLIHGIEREAFPQFFENEQDTEFSFGKRNSRLYKHYRNTIIGLWRENSKKHLSSAICRRNLPGDVWNIIRIHGFLENWGLINFPAKEHNKGRLIKKSQPLECHVCGTPVDQAYYLTHIQGEIFQICSSCYSSACYPQEIKQQQFKRVLVDKHISPSFKIMDTSDQARVLEVMISSGGTQKEKDRDIWFALQKQFPNYSREDLLKNVLNIPARINASSNIFEYNEDHHMRQLSRSATIKQPSIFEDDQNHLTASVAMSNYLLKTSPEAYPELQDIFNAAEEHSQYLASVQEQKIEELVKLLVEVTLSKLEYKSLFIYEYERLVENQNTCNTRMIMNTLAECIKYNYRSIREAPSEQQNRQDEPPPSELKEIDFLSQLAYINFDAM